MSQQPVGQSAGLGIPAEEALRGLMARYQEGDPASAEALVQLLSPLLLRFLSGYAHLGMMPEDLLQECWLQIHRARHTFRLNAPVLPWVLAIARHVRRDAYRRCSRARSHETALDLAPESVLATAVPAEYTGVAHLMNGLPRSQQQVLFMMKVAGMSLEEVAAATSSTVGAVKQKAHRAYASLRHRLKACADS